MPRPSSQRLHSLLDAQAVRNEKVTDLDGMVRHGAGEWGANGITINNNQHPPLVIHPASRGVAAHTAGLFRSVRGAKGGWFFPRGGSPS